MLTRNGQDQTNETGKNLPVSFVCTTFVADFKNGVP